jgi:hypothetical protein
MQHRNPRCGLIPDALMKIEEAPCKTKNYYCILLRIICMDVYYMLFSGMLIRKYLQYNGCLETFPMLLESLATTARIGDTVGSKS